MFHWICPECGREIAPTVRECPACDPSAVAAELALVGVVEAPPARTITSVAPPARTITSVAPPARTITSAAPPGRTITSAAPPARTIASAPLKQRNASSVVLKARIAESEPPEAPSAEPILPQLESGPSGDFPHDLFTLDIEEETPAPLTVKPPELKASDPPASQQSFPLASPTPAVPPTLRAWIANLGPATETPTPPLTGCTQAKPVAEPALVRSKIALPPVSARNTPRLAARPSETQPEALAVPVPAPNQPGTPYAGPAPALAALANYSPLAGRPMRPAVPSREVLKRETGPRSTLAGPMLTSRLMRFTDRELNTILPKRRLVKKSLIPGWAATVLIVGTVLVAGFNSIFSIVPKSGASGADAPKVSAGNDVEVSTAAAASSVPPAPESSNSLSKAIEVTGFRFQMDPSKKPEIQYLVVNHTPNPFSGVTVYVTLHAAHEAPGQPPLGRFQFGAPNLKPFESKEMASAIERVNRPNDLPEWQDVRAEVELGQ